MQVEKKQLTTTGYKWILIMVLLAALMIAVFIYYNRKIKTINNELQRISLVNGEW
jgi:uncharacterized integral membrane protein